MQALPRRAYRPGPAIRQAPSVDQGKFHGAVAALDQSVHARFLRHALRFPEGGEPLLASAIGNLSLVAARQYLRAMNVTVSRAVCEW